MSITINLYYTGTNGNARKFAEEMVVSGIVEAVRAEEGNEKYEYFGQINPFPRWGNFQNFGKIIRTVDIEDVGHTVSLIPGIIECFR